MSVAPTPTNRKLSLTDVNQSLLRGWEVFRSMPAVSLAFGAVVASVHAVLRHLIMSIAWGLLLRVSIVSSILLLPLLAVVLPVMSYASFAFYQRVFPPNELI